MRLITYLESLGKIGSNMMRIQIFRTPGWDCLNHTTMLLQNKLSGRFSHLEKLKRSSGELLKSYNLMKR